MQLTKDFKLKVIEAIKKARANYGGSDADYAKHLDINKAILSRILNGETERVLADGEWLRLARHLDVNPSERRWNAAKTAVFEALRQEIVFCKTHSKGRVFVDDCGIGKTFTAKYLSRELKHCFYVDCSQAKTKNQFVKALARAIGVDNKGRVMDIKENIKYYLANMLEKPIVILDEAGDLDYNAFLEVKEFWNSTENRCGWYLMGAEGFRYKIQRGINSKKVGYREIFSRFSDKFSSIVPADRQERLAFYNRLITDVLSANVGDKAIIPALVKKCLTVDESGEIGGVRRAESLLILTQSEAA